MAQWTTFVSSRNFAFSQGFAFGLLRNDLSIMTSSDALGPFRNAPGRQPAHRVDQVALEVRAELRHAVAIGIGLQVPVDHQRKRAADQSVEDVVVTVDRLPADAGQDVRDETLLSCARYWSVVAGGTRGSANTPRPRDSVAFGRQRTK